MAIFNRTVLLSAALFLNAATAGESYPFVDQGTFEIASVPGQALQRIAGSTVAYSEVDDVLLNARIERKFKAGTANDFRLVLGVFDAHSGERIAEIDDVLFVDLLVNLPESPTQGEYFHEPASSSLTSIYDHRSDSFLVAWSQNLTNTDLPEFPPAQDENAGNKTFYVTVENDGSKWKSSPVRELTNAASIGPKIHSSLFFNEDTLYFVKREGAFDVGISTLEINDGNYTAEAIATMSLRIDTPMEGVPFNIHDADVALDIANNRLIVAAPLAELLTRQDPEHGNSYYEYRTALVAKALSLSDWQQSETLVLTPTTDVPHVTRINSPAGSGARFALSGVTMAWIPETTNGGNGQVRLTYVDETNASPKVVSQRLRTGDGSFLSDIDTFENRVVLGDITRSYFPTTIYDSRQRLFTTSWGNSEFSQLHVNGGFSGAGPNGTNTYTNLRPPSSTGVSSTTRIIQTRHGNLVHFWEQRRAEVVNLSWYWADLALTSRLIGNPPPLKTDDEFTVEATISHTRDPRSLSVAGIGPLRLKFEDTDDLEFVGVNSDSFQGDAFSGLLHTEELATGGSATVEATFRNRRPSNNKIPEEVFPATIEMVHGYNHDVDSSNNTDHVSLTYHVTPGDEPGSGGNDDGEDNGNDDDSRNGSDSGGGSLGLGLLTTLLFLRRRLR